MPDSPAGAGKAGTPEGQKIADRARANRERELTIKAKGKGKGK